MNILSIDLLNKVVDGPFKDLEFKSSHPHILVAYIFGWLTKNIFGWTGIAIVYMLQNVPWLGCCKWCIYFVCIFVCIILNECLVLVNSTLYI